MKGSAADRKPDIVVPHLFRVRPEHGKGLRGRMLREEWRTGGTSRMGFWNEIAFGAELKDAGDSAKYPLAHQGLRILLELLRQPGRRFAILFTVRRSLFQLFVANASGVFMSPAVDAKKDPATVSHLIRRLTELLPHEYGLDIELCPFPKLSSPLPIDSIVPGYSLAKVLRAREDVTGRCTSVFKLEPQDRRQKNLILKLTFVDTARSVNETTVLARIREARDADPTSVAGLVCVADEYMLNWNVTDTAAGIRMDPDRFRALRREGASEAAAVPSADQQAPATPDGPVVRRYQAILLDAAGVPCTHYTSRLHFWRGIIDAVKGKPKARAQDGTQLKPDRVLAHRNLFRLGFLHRDVSTGNIMLAADASAPCAGTLIDYDLTKEKGATQSGALHRTVSPKLRSKPNASCN